ncbi:MAG: AarF/UbiB family protein [Candidatus Microbacterium phytovorans]|uniref:AarF/UbiB family protein n=1 Tax=Candidatus Microbacterium phytovorans TaxID=3121374 RepID=A0AAJ6B437_9MICO|nr:AarF/UbiB family protein [Microbacterium sp.]WEK12426.1 MAG: AarF/UbiB family protein [Microbacterium sp.]
MPGGRARYRRILRFSARAIAQAWWYELALPRLGLRRVADRTRAHRLQVTARRFRALAVDLGGLMIKVGQFLSSRLDVLPPEVTGELEQLQDEVPPVPFPEIRALAEAELGVPLSRAFAAVDERPLAAASLGQAHRARLAPEDAALAGFEAVVLKVQRPGIDAIVEIDLAALRRVAGWLSRVRIVSDRVDMPALVEEFAHTSSDEIDYVHEAANAERFTANIADGARVGAPEIVWERTTRRVLTLADVTAIKVNDVAALRAAGIDPAEVATEFAAVMFDQLFGDGFFHADPHPGNIFVTPHAPDVSGRTWRFTFIDFGMMGQVPEGLRRGLRRVVIAVAARDGRGLVAGIQEVGVLLPSADTADLERALTQLFARFGGMGFAELQEVDPREFRDFADEFGEVVRSLPFQFPEDFLLIIRAMSLTSGLCSALDPSFNIWNAVEPYAQRLLSEESGGVVRDVGARAWGAVRGLAAVPGRLDELLTRVEEGRLAVQSPSVERRLGRLEQGLRRLVSAVVFAALFVGGIALRAQDAVFGTIVMALSVPPLLHAVLAGIGSRRSRSRR